jgi:hypothetical protein
MPGVLTATVHQLKIGLQGAAPPLWRRIQVPSAASLGLLHDVIQVAFGLGGLSPASLPRRARPRVG